MECPADSNYLIYKENAEDKILNDTRTTESSKIKETEFQSEASEIVK